MAEKMDLHGEPVEEILLFSHRKKVADAFEKIIEGTIYKNCPLNVVNFLYGNHLLNVDEVKKFIRKLEEKGDENGNSTRD